MKKTSQYLEHCGPQTVPGLQRRPSQWSLQSRRVCRALVPGGRIAIRDILMEETRTQPVAGALFAVNMLVATEGGGTFTFAELREDLASAGFTKAAIVRADDAMNSVVVAQKPDSV